MAEKQNTPEIRFEGFTDPWEQRKLGDMGTTYGGLTGKSKDDFGHGAAWFVPYTNVFDNPVGDSTRLERVEIDPSQNVVRRGDALFTVSSETPEEVGMSSVWPSDLDDLYLNSFCFGYRQDGSFDPSYLAYMLRADSFRNQIEMLAQGISRFNISKGKVMEIEVPVPDKREQARIGRLFVDLDSLITLHQRKYDKLCTVKKSMLDKMFPKSGETEPEIRFEGFTDPWEQRKLGEVASEFQSGEFISATEITENGDYPVYGGNGLRGYANRYNHEGFYALIGRQGALCGNVNCADGKAYFTEHAVAVQANQCNDTGFLVYLLSRMNLGQYSGQSAQPGLAVSTLKEVETLLPSKHEQYRIGSLLKDLDSLITLHQRKLELLRNIKKSLLDRMFV